MKIGSKPAVAVVSALFLFYLYLLIKIILFKFGEVSVTFVWEQFSKSAAHPSRAVAGLLHGNLVPFRTISDSLQRPTFHNMVNLFGNIALFVPFGTMAAILVPNLFVSLLMAFGFSLSLEISQAVLSMGTFDADDLVLNAFGGLTGYWLYQIARSLLPMRTVLHKH
ncbi:VanZ family protein [Paenibacillus thailandensis]|uniref:VanZ family protein n=1 Tax=Paenibacillus thailandensis TaxID=393250 RepID=A0ABW5R1X2_9BACL